MEIKTHAIHLSSDHLTLRPLTEADWSFLMQWNTDPAVLFFSEGDAVSAYTLEDIQSIYRTVSQTALCFIIEVDGRPVGECWLQQMNLERILYDYPNFDCRRIDLLIGDRTLWGHGLGTEVIRLLTELAWQEGVDYIFGVDITDYNPASLRAFQKNDYRLVARTPQPAGCKARNIQDVIAKNPALGFHAYAVHAFFDPATDAAIRQAWRDLAEAGVAAYLYQSANRPHLTLGIYRALDLPETRRRLAELAARTAPLPVSFPYLGIFPGSQEVFVGLTATEKLLDLHTAVSDVLEGISELPDFDYYRPGHWVPHCSLALEYDGSRLFEALEIARRLSLPLNGQICELGLTEMRPVRHLNDWFLAPKE